jgi:hypothetical protein
VQKKQDYIPSLFFGSPERVKIIFSDGDYWIDVPKTFTDFAEQHLAEDETLSDYVHLAILNHSLAIPKKEKGSKGAGRPKKRKNYDPSTT